VWRGTLAFGLVALPVGLYPGARRVGAPLRLLAPDGTPLSRRYYCPLDGRFLGPEEVVRGYPVGGGEYVTLEDEELEALDPERSRAIDLDVFVPVEHVDPAYVVASYVLVPEPPAVTAYRLLARAMAEAGRAGIATFVMRGRSYLMAIVSRDGTLRGLTLRYAEELREPAEVGLPELGTADARTVERLTSAARTLFADDLDPGELEDATARGVASLAEGKLVRGEDVLAPPPAAEPDELDEELEAALVDVMELLRERLGRAYGA
jgi:DNA end-binding protein Ku